MHHEEPDLLFTLAHGAGYDPYDGLDRFDRTVDMRWTWCMSGSSGSGSSGSSGDGGGCEPDVVEQVCYGYDRASNRTHRAMPIAAWWGENLDERYGYDRLDRLVDFDRGALTRENSLIDPLVRKAQWTLDATGNWSRFRRFDQHDAGAALDQTRGHNGANEVTDIAETVGRVWASPTHDRAGNMLVIPRPSDPRESYIATYDAWHRLVKLEQSDGAGGLEPVAEYQYDGRNFRTVKRTYTGGVLSETRHFYYSSQWQVLEERVDASEAAVCQYVWGERYIDDLVLRDRDATGSGALDERLYALQDANWNVIAISNPDGQMQERYAYYAYGSPAIHDGAFTPIAATAYAWPYTYTGRRLDEETGLMYYRNRMYHVELGRFVSRDPIGYDAGDMNSYRYALGNPLKLADPSGQRVYVLERQLAVAAMPGSNWWDNFIRYLTLGRDFGISHTVSYYRDHTWHCILVVADTCNAMPDLSTGELMGFDMAPEHTWDFQSNNRVYHPAHDFHPAETEEFPVSAYSRFRVRVVDGTNDHDAAVRNAITAKTAKHPQYDAGGAGRYNCCDWVYDVLRHAGLGWSYENPNPMPFGPQEVPSHVYLGAATTAIDSF